jgi:hypothetical protein
MDTGVCQDIHTSNVSFTKYDLFFKAKRDSTEEYVRELVEASWSDDPLSTIKTIFYIRDCRGGKGERKLFYQLIRWLWMNHPDHLLMYLHLIPHYGSFKDYKELLKIHPSLSDRIVQTWMKFVMDENQPQLIRSLAVKYIPIQDSRFCGELTHKQFRVYIRNLRDHLSKRLKNVDQHGEVKGVGHLETPIHSFPKMQFVSQRITEEMLQPNIDGTPLVLISLKTWDEVASPDLELQCPVIFLRWIHCPVDFPHTTIPNLTLVEGDDPLVIKTLIVEKDLSEKLIYEKVIIHSDRYNQIK